MRLERLQDEGLCPSRENFASAGLLKSRVRELSPGSEVEYRFLDPADEEEELSSRPWM